MREAIYVGGKQREVGAMRRDAGRPALHSWGKRVVVVTPVEYCCLIDDWEMKCGECYCDGCGHFEVGSTASV
jgi:hypothetical protein